MAAITRRQPQSYAKCRPRMQQPGGGAVIAGINGVIRRLSAKIRPKTQPEGCRPGPPSPPAPEPIEISGQTAT
jgi:hypothetical protein